MDINETDKYYREKYRAHKKNTFSQWSPLRYFPVPKQPITFIVLVTLSGAMVQMLTSYLWWVPSMFTVFLMWNLIIVLMKREDIVEECSIQEAVFEEGIKDDLADGGLYGPMYVTDEDREYILDECIHMRWKLSLWQELKLYWKELLLMCMFYAVAYDVIYFV